MQTAFSVTFLLGICFFVGTGRAQPKHEMASLCDLQAKASEGSHVSVRVSGLYTNGPDRGTLEGTACPGQTTLVELALQSGRNQNKLSRLFDRSPRARAYVVFEGEFYGPPMPDPKLPEAIRKTYHPGWDYESKTKLVVHVILDVKVAPATEATPRVAPTYPASNQIYGYRYDAVGDVTNDGTYTYTWDAEAHLTKVVNGGGTTISTNTYNALGQRVRDVTTSATTDEAYGGDGSLLWGWTGNPSTNRSFVPFKGDILAEYYSGGTLFDHSDELGSVTTSTNYYNGGVCQERLFYPFGELWTGAGSSGMHQTFAKLPDYDAETDEYNTLNRHYTPSGRWMSPDPGGLKVVRLDDPQTWNMYAYVRNNPTTLTDPTGLFDCDASNGDCEVINGVLVNTSNPNDKTKDFKPKAQGTQRQPKQKPPANSRKDIVLVPAGKPQR